ncbi:unnamed protein product [Ostreobium quekettii]|uniref:Uncharacterized protein n=1 Tax=Ostreobium quekettii TaxID=121088 RepID=A0A8S1ISH3_9CHLO|nr:unnamed protein product [Ostreobium quekettii]|eukprot:evm.model.scf_1163.6 EVM.evm.TU.scf_1163.6   scf_1163:35431-38038(+)
MDPPPGLGGRAWTGLTNSSPGDWGEACRMAERRLAAGIADAIPGIVSWTQPDLEEKGLEWRACRRTVYEVVLMHNSSGAKDAYRNPRWRAPRGGRYQPPAGLSVQPWMRIAEWSARGALAANWEQGGQTEHGQWWQREREERRKARQESLRSIGHQPGDLFSPDLWRKIDMRRGHQEQSH